MLQEVSGIRKTVFSLYSGVGGGAGGDVDDEAATKNRIIMEQEKEIDFLKQRMKVRKPHYISLYIHAHHVALACGTLFRCLFPFSPFYKTHESAPLPFTPGDPGPDAGLGA